MSFRTRKPVRMVGGVVNSGNLDTGEVNWTRGGQRVVCVHSGGLLNAGSGFAPGGVVSTDQLVIFSGAGRLNTIIPLVAISGVRVVFYDSSVAARSGGGAGNGGVESGYPTLAVIPANSFNAPNTLGGPLPIEVDVPFRSGLAVSNISGAPGFSAVYTPEAFRSGAGDQFD